MGKHKPLSLDTHKYRTTFTSTTKLVLRFSTWKSPKPLGGEGSLRGTGGVGGGGTRELIMTYKRTSGGLRHNRKKRYLFPHWNLWRKAGCIFSDFHAPPCTNFRTYCMIDLSWQPGLWKLRILLRSLTDYCRAGQKIRSPTWGIVWWSLLAEIWLIVVYTFYLGIIHLCVVC
jgi:hypothetical protein